MPTNVTFLYSQNSSESKRFALSDDNRDDINGNTVVCQSIPGLKFFHKWSKRTYKIRKVFIYIYIDIFAHQTLLQIVGWILFKAIAAL